MILHFNRALNNTSIQGAAVFGACQDPVFFVLFFSLLQFKLQFIRVSQIDSKFSANCYFYSKTGKLTNLNNESDLYTAHKVQVAIPLQLFWVRSQSLLLPTYGHQKREERTQCLATYANLAEAFGYERRKMMELRLDDVVEREGEK